MKVLQWCRANAMPVIAVLAAAVTAVFVPPDSAYLGYYDVKTLSCLFCILAGAQAAGKGLANLKLFGAQLGIALQKSLIVG